MQSRVLTAGLFLVLLVIWVVGPGLLPTCLSSGSDEHKPTSSCRGTVASGIDPEVQKRNVLQAQRASKKYQEMGMLSDQAGYDSVLADGTVNPDLMAILNIDSEKSTELQSVIDKYWALAEKSMAERLVRDPRRGDGCFLVPADRQKGEDLLFNLEQDVRRIVGGDSAKGIMSGMHARKKFGWFGKLDIKIKLLESEHLNENALILNVECCDPGTGTLIQSLSRLSPGSEHYSRMFGRGFPLPVQTD